MMNFSKFVRAALFFSAGIVVASSAHARPAKCFNSTDGYYQCNYRSFGGNGSFTITARGYPTLTLAVIQRGYTAEGFIKFGDGYQEALPGTYVRSRKNRACWINDVNRDKVCAWGQ